MIDLFGIILTHGLLALAAWRLLKRADLDSDIGSDSGAGDPGIGEAPRSRPGMRLPRD